MVWEKGVPLADMIHGINLITPPEMLHTVGVGIAVYIIAVIKDCLGVAGNEPSLSNTCLYVYISTPVFENCDR